MADRGSEQPSEQASRLVDFRARERGSAIPPSDAVGPRDHPPGRAGEGLRGPRVRRGIRDRGQGAAAGAVGEQSSLGGREPAPVRLLARAADAQGRERLHHLWPAAAGDGLRGVAVRGRLAAALAVAALAVAGCGGDNSTIDSTTPTAPAATSPTTATTPTTPSSTSTSPYSTAPQ